MMTHRIRTACLAGALAALPVTLVAQEAEQRSSFSGTLSVLNTQPLGNLRTGPGIGLAASAAWAPVADGPVRLRVDLRVASYGHESRRFCISETVGCWIEVDVNTDFVNVFAGVGPELAVPILGSELVLDATAGLGYFGVSSSMEGIDENESFGTTNHYDDTVFAWSAGGELRIPVSRVVAINLGTHYLHNGQASYVVEGGITRNPDGTLNVDALTTDANMVAITLGVAVRPMLGLGGGGHGIH